MKIYSVEKVVRVYAEIATDNGDFRVYEDGEVMIWKFDTNQFDYYPTYEDYYEEIKEVGMKMLHFNKGV